MINKLKVTIKTMIDRVGYENKQDIVQYKHVYLYSIQYMLYMSGKMNQKYMYITKNVST